MADILIRGMEMPENEQLRIVLNPNGQLFVDHGMTFTEYEAVELPEHGDLIDRGSAIIALEVEGYTKNMRVHKNILRLPVIVPSNKEETE